jgi:hypothetical protein
MSDNKADKAHKDEDIIEDDDLVIKDSTKDEEAKTTEPEEEEPKPAKGEPTGEELKQAMDDAEKEAATLPSPVQQPKKKLGGKLSRKKLALIISAAVIVVVAVLFAIPLTRYAIMGVFVKRDVTVTLHDSQTNKPVSNVAVDIGSASGITDAKGAVTLKNVPVGSKKITTHKKYYKDATAEQTVPITGNNPSFSLSIEATGRQVPVKVINKISQQPIEGADITADGTSSKTDKNGEATIVLPADKADMDATVTLGGYNKSSVKVVITDQKDDKNTFAVTPAGKVYFLSKRNGTIDVMKSDIDGSNAQTVVKGTGNEVENGTVLLASRDWKYLVLQARREGDKDKLYLINAANGDKMTTIDEGDANFTAVGWYNQYFMYTTIRGNVQNWQPKKTALKSYDAQIGQLTTLDETDASGDSSTYAQQEFGDTYIIGGGLLYTKTWYGSSSIVKGKTATVNTVQPDGKNKQTLKDLGPINGILQARLYAPGEVYFRFSSYDPPYKNVFYEYEDGQVKSADISDETFSKVYPTYLVSPSSKYTFWTESRDGKDVLFVGDKDAKNGTQINTTENYKPYGWLGDDYLLVSKGGSELYIISRTNPGAPLKVTDYHKPNVSFYGYGYGYGGL